MKRTLPLVRCLAALFCCALPLLGSAQSPLGRLFDFEAADLSIETALLELSRQSGVAIGFSNQIFDQRHQVRFKARQTSLAALLDKVLEGTDVGWREVDGQIMLFKKPPAEHTLSGFVEDATNGERLVGAYVMELNSGRSATSNAYGFFSLRLPSGKPARLVVSMLGFQLAQMTLALSQDRRLLMPLSPVMSDLPDVAVSSDSVESRLRPFYPKLEENLMRLPIAKMPALGGEADVARSAALLPGISSNIDGLGGWSVRGGDTDQNLVLVDDAVVFNPAHGLGLFSVFNTDIVRSARLWKGDAPARFGGRGASLLDVRTREGNMQRVSGAVSLGWLAGSLSLEVPLKKERGAVLFSARRSLAGPILTYFSEKNKKQDGLQGTSDYYFSDVNIKANWMFSPQDRLYVSLYEGLDYFFDENSFTVDSAGPDPEAPAFRYGSDNTYNWKNQFLSLRWNRLFSDKCFANTVFTASRFDLHSESKTSFQFEGMPELPQFSFSLLSNTKLRDYTIKTDVDWFAHERLTLRAGAQLSWSNVLPFLFFGNLQTSSEWIVVDSTGAVSPSSELRFEKGVTVVAHGEAEWMPSPNWRLRAGLRAETFSNRGKTWALPQPRLYAEHKWRNGWSASASWSQMAQTLRVVSPNWIESTSDLWLLASPNLPPQTTRQAALGAGWSGKGWGVRAEVFHKSMKNVEEYDAEWHYDDGDTIIYIDPTQYSQGLREWELEVALGQGKSVGLEVLLEKTAGSTTGWVSWTLSRSDRRFDRLNFGEWFPARFDRRHQLKLALFQQVGKSLTFSATWQFATGDAVSRLLLASQPTPNANPRLRLLDLHQNTIQLQRLGYGDVRQPAQHRLDVAATWQWHTKHSQQQIALGAYNTYRQGNVYFSYWLWDNFGNLERKEINGLPFLPYLSWKIRF